MADAFDRWIEWPTTRPAKDLGFRPMSTPA